MRSAPKASPDLHSPDRLTTVEQRMGVKLPRAYKDFLLSIHGYGLAIPGLILDCNRLFSSREASEHLLRDSKADFWLDRSDFIFLFDEHYRFLFFRCDHRENPPVYRFFEGESWPREIASSFTEWLEQLAPS